MRVLYAGGWDLLHHGHVRALHAARDLAGPDGELIVGVNSDRLMQHYKRNPELDQDQRVLDVKRQGIATEVIIWDGPQGQAGQIVNVRPDVYVAGTDWLAKDLAGQLCIPSLAWFDAQHISLMFLRRTQGISTTQLIQALDNGQA